MEHFKFAKDSELNKMIIELQELKNKIENK